MGTLEYRFYEEYHTKDGRSFERGEQDPAGTKISQREKKKKAESEDDYFT